MTGQLAALRAEESSLRHRAETADQYLNEAERMMVRHITERAATEVRWHQELLAGPPKITADLGDGAGGFRGSPAGGQGPS